MDNKYICFNGKYYDITYDLPDIMDNVAPYKHRVTGEVRYLSVYDKYVAVHKYEYENGVHLQDCRDLFEPIEDTKALRILHGPKKE